MNGMLVALIVAASGVETTWETRPQGDQVFVIQLDDQAIAALRAGHPITSIIPEGVSPVGAVRLQYGQQQLQKPVLAANAESEAEVAQVANTATIAFLQQAQPNPNQSASGSNSRTFLPSEAYQRQGEWSAAPNAVDRGVPLTPTLAGNQRPQATNSGLADTGQIRVSPEALQWELSQYMNSPLLQGLPYPTGNPPAQAPTTNPAFNNQFVNNAGQATVGFPVQNPAQPIGTGIPSSAPVGATQWDNSRSFTSVDPNRDFPRTGTQDWRSVSQQGSSNLGAPSFQTPLPGPTNVSNNQPQWQPNYNPSNPSGTLANTPLLNPPQAPNFNGNPAYSNGSWTTGQGWNNSALAQNNAATNGSIPVSTPTTYLPNSNPLNLPAWVRSQGPNASSNAGQELAATIRRTNYTPTTSGTSLGTSAGGSTTGNSSTDSSGSSSTRPVSSSSGSITPRGSLDEEREPPQDTSVLALGMLFLSIGLNVYFGYLIRGFYLKTRQLARDLRESILTT